MQGQSLDESKTFVKAIYYGNPKQGKTTAMAGASRLGQMVAVDIEGRGWYAPALRKRGVIPENITIFRAKSFADMEAIYWDIMGMVQDDIPLVACAVDHMTELEAVLLQDAREKRIAKAERKLKEGTGSKEVREALAEELDPYTSERQDYGVWTNQGRKVMRMYRDLPMNVAFAAHFRTEMGVRVPALTEKFRNDLVGSMDMVIGCATMVVPGDSNVEYVGYMREIKGWSGGDMFGVTPPVVVNPAFDRLIQAAAGELDFNTDPIQQAFKAKFN